MAIKSNATQEFVPIKEVKDGIVVLKNGALRAIVMASSINFALKSEDEQIAILSQFQNFLNSLDFTVQISIQSRRLDIRPYLALLADREKQQTNDLLKIQIQEYIEFVKTFTESSDIMTKTFFVVVPYTPAIISGSKSVTGLFGKKKSDSEHDAERNEQFQEQRTQLEQRISVVEQGLMRCGVRSVRLGSEEVIEVFYKMFNPGETENVIQTQK